jgi:hypothetical protein
MKVGKGRWKKKRLKGDMDAMKGETSTRPMVGIYAPFAKNRVTRLAGIEDKGSRCT